MPLSLKNPYILSNCLSERSMSASADWISSSVRFPLPTPIFASVLTADSSSSGGVFEGPAVSTVRASAAPEAASTGFAAALRAAFFAGTLSGVASAAPVGAGVFFFATRAFALAAAFGSAWLPGLATDLAAGFAGVALTADVTAALAAAFEPAFGAGFAVDFATFGAAGAEGFFAGAAAVLVFAPPFGSTFFRSAFAGAEVTVDFAPTLVEVAMDPRGVALSAALDAGFEARAGAAATADFAERGFALAGLSADVPAEAAFGSRAVAVLSAALAVLLVVLALFGLSTTILLVLVVPTVLFPQRS